MRKNGGRVRVTQTAAGGARLQCTWLRVRLTLCPPRARTGAHAHCRALQMRESTPVCCQLQPRLSPAAAGCASSPASSGALMGCCVGRQGDIAGAGRQGVLHAGQLRCCSTSARRAGLGELLRRPPIWLAGGWVHEASACCNAGCERQRPPCSAAGALAAAGLNWRCEALSSSCRRCGAVGALAQCRDVTQPHAAGAVVRSRC